MICTTNVNMIQNLIDVMKRVIVKEGQSKVISSYFNRKEFISNAKKAIFELLGEIEHEIIGIRTGEKLHELLISEYEIRNCWKYKDKFILFGNHDTKKEEEFIKKYDLKKLELVENYSSENAEKLSKTELKQNIIESGLINNSST